MGLSGIPCDMHGLGRGLFDPYRFGRGKGRYTAFVLTLGLHIPEDRLARRTADLEGLGGSKWHSL